MLSYATLSTPIFFGSDCFFLGGVPESQNLWGLGLYGDHHGFGLWEVPWAFSEKWPVFMEPSDHRLTMFIP